MADQQYDISPNQKRILEEQARRRTILRQEFLKQSSNPHMHGTGESGAVFDKALQRFIALKATSYDHFKPTPKTTGLGIFLTVGPIIAYALLLQNIKDREEEKYRSGKVAYKDRSFIFQ